MNINENWQKFRSQTIKEETEVTTQEFIDKMNSFAKHTWIFFDTETMGLEPNSDQLTEIAAIAVSPVGWRDDAEFIGEFNEKIKLNPESLERLNNPESPERMDWEKEQSKFKKRLDKPQDVLSLTRYGERGRAFMSEKRALEEFVNFISQFDNPLLLAQNAAFDMKFVSTRLAKYDGALEKLPVLDTMTVMNNYMVPLLRTLAKQQDWEAKKILNKLTQKSQWGGRYTSVSMGVVSKAFNISINDWHNALADVKMMMAMFREVYKLLKRDSDVNIRPSYDKVMAKQHRRNKKKRK